MHASSLRLGPAAAGLLWLLAGCADQEPASDQNDKEALETEGAGDNETSNAASSSGLPCDVAEIVEAKCGNCHGASTQFGAPNSLVSAADFQVTHDGKKMSQIVKTRINATTAQMPPTGMPQLTAAEKKALNAWLDKGAPKSTASCDGGDDGGDHGGGDHPPGDDGANIDTTGLECFKLTAHNGDGKTPYKVGAAKDAYFNFTFAAPWGKDPVYAVVFRPIIDNPKVIHHWLLFQENGKVAPSGAVRSIGAHPNALLLNGWAPGGTPTNLRRGGLDVGQELSGTKSYTIEYHYNSNDPGAVDASGVEICVQRKKPKNLASLAWLGKDQLGVPATKWKGTCRPAVQQRIHILGVSPHMHKTGTHMKAVINRKDGTKEVLHDKPFDFNFQIQYDKDVWIEPGDTITTECTFSKPMAFGESTNAEMCYLFTLHYPRNALMDNGLWGKLAHGAGSCLGQ